MITEDEITDEEFKALTDALEGVGHYDPSVKDMLTHIRDSDLKWVGFSIEYTSTVTREYPHRKIQSVKAINLPEAGRFEKAIYEFAADPDKFLPLIEEMGMLPSDSANYGGREIILALGENNFPLGKLFSPKTSSKTVYSTV